MDVEQRARELLAFALMEKGEHLDALHALSGDMDGTPAHRAIIAALTPPEGYAEMARDAQRYRYIRSIAAGEPHEFGWIEEAAFVASNGDPNQFDFNIDEQMAARPEVTRDLVPDEVWITFDSEGQYEEIEYNFFGVTDAERRMQRRAERFGLRSVKFVRAEK